MHFEKRQILKWHGEGKLPLSLTLKRVFDTEKPEQWQLMQQQEKQEEKKQEESREHAASNVKITAVLKKSATSNYAGNFSYYARGAGKSRAEKVYGKISPNIGHLYGRNRPSLVKFFSDYFTIDKVACNFNYKSKLKVDGKEIKPGCSMPYTWEAHHMIPGDAFTSVIEGIKEKKPIFNARQYRLMLMSDYDVNNGNNMIALPSNRMDFFQPVHDLIQHPSNHEAYTARVLSEMKKVADKLEKLTDDLEKPHKDVVAKIAESLKNLENALWDLIIKIGQASVAAVVKKQEVKLKEEDKALLKYQTEKGDTQYPMAALA